MSGHGTDGKLIDGYLREVEASLRVDAERKRQIVGELRSHLREKAADLKRRDMARSDEDVEREVLAELGDPRTLALAYEPEGVAVLKDQAGRTVHRFSEAVGRGAKAVGRKAGKALKVVAIALAVMLALGLVVAGWAYYEFKPYLTALAEEGDPVYSYSERCAGTPCFGTTANDTFYVSEKAKNVWLQVELHGTRPDRGGEALSNGTVTLRIQDATGDVRLDRTFTMSNGSIVDHEVSWSAEAGNWTVLVELAGFQGWVSVDVHATSVNGPWRDD